jgi:NAD(P)-dependent dehydrogenase (short-subunit alcohol dehydrogenase family)
LPIPDFSERPLRDLISLAGRVAVVTGGARGIGFAISARLAEAGAHVLIGDLREEDAAEAARGIARLGGTALPGELDVADSAAVGALADRAVRELGGIDILVNNAGIYPCAPVLDMTDEEWDRVLDIDLRGAFAGAREAGRRMVEAGRGGVILNIASTASYRVAGTGVSHYVAAKHGVLGLTKSLAVELGPYAIRVLAIAPTVTRTPGLEAGRAAFEAGGFRLDELGATLPLGRIAVPDDVARVALFCASDLAALMTGSTLLVDAGAMAI